MSFFKHDGYLMKFITTKKIIYSVEFPKMVLDFHLMNLGEINFKNSSKLFFLFLEFKLFLSYKKKKQKS